MSSQGMILDGGGWLTEEVAAAQRALVERQLQAPDQVAPFRYFIWAMEQIKPLPGTRLLDAGCGCGHYGLLLRDRYPGIVYTGTDYSLAMFEQARELNPISEFGVCAFDDNAFDTYDIVLVSQVMEYQPDPWAALELLLAKVKRHVIIHRIRLTEGYSRQHLEPTYAGHVGNTYLWNLEELSRFIDKRAENVTSKLWDGGKQVTFVAEAFA